MHTYTSACMYLHAGVYVYIYILVCAHLCNSKSVQAHRYIPLHITYLDVSRGRPFTEVSCGAHPTGVQDLLADCVLREEASAWERAPAGVRELPVESSGRCMYIYIYIGIDT